jgi:hypothetical protein
MDNAAHNAAHNTQRTTCNVQQRTDNMRRAADKMQPTNGAVLHAAHVQHATEGTRCNAARRVVSQFGPTNFNNKYGTTKKFSRVLRSAAAGTAEGVVRGHAACRR